MIIEVNKYSEDDRLKNESIFSCASGKLGVRGCFEEGTPNNKVSIRGAYLNGYCEDVDITYNEQLYGFPTSKQTIVNLPDAQGIEVYANGEKLVCWSEKTSNFKYCLNMERGLVERSFIYDTGKGKIQLNFERVVSFVRQGLFCIECKIKSIDYEGQIEIKSYLNGDITNFTNPSDPRVASGDGKTLNILSSKNIDDVQTIECETINSHQKAKVTVINKISKGKFEYSKENNLLIASCKLETKVNEEIKLDKYCSYVDSSQIETIDSALKDGFV